MSGFLGQVPEEVEQLAAEFDHQATEVENVISAVTTRLQGTSWRGSDRDNFEGTWQGEITNNLNQLSQVLRDTGMTANNNAQQQRTASA